MNLYSDNFRNGERLPDAHAYARDNISPALRWDSLPDGTVELALICDDPDAPGGSWIHWVFYGISADAGSINPSVSKEKQPKAYPGSSQGTNGFGKIGYDGPHPPPGRAHRYVFQLYALSKPLNLSPGATASQLSAAMKGKILAKKELVGLFSR